MMTLDYKGRSWVENLGKSDKIILERSLTGAITGKSSNNLAHDEFYPQYNGSEITT